MSMSRAEADIMDVVKDWAGQVFRARANKTRPLRINFYRRLEPGSPSLAKGWAEGWADVVAAIPARKDAARLNCIYINTQYDYWAQGAIAQSAIKRISRAEFLRAFASK